MNILTSGDYYILALALPLLASLFAFKLRTENLREGIIILCGILLVLVNFALLADLENGEVSTYNIGSFANGVGIISFKIDYLGAIFSLLASFLWVVTTIYSIGYMRGNKEANQPRFYGFFALAIFGAMALSYSSNLLTLFVFYEFLTLSTYPLVTHTQTAEAKKSGRTYLGTLISSSIFLQLPAIIAIYFLTGGGEFSSTPLLEGLQITNIDIAILLALFTFGIGKTAVMPIHKWLPAAMVAPTPVSALLHAVAVVKAGLFTLIKVVVYVFGVENLQSIYSSTPFAIGWLAWLGLATTIIASCIALRQDNLKLRLAYSTISQLSYVVMACGLFNIKAIMAGGIHIVAHAFGKITLFFAAGAIYTASKKKNISEFNGLAKRMPFTAFFFAIGALSMIGLPPTAGLLTKIYLMQAAHEHSFYFVVGLVVSTLLNASYFLPIIFAMYFYREDTPAKSPYTNHKEAPVTMLIAMSITVFMCVTVFIYPDLLLELVSKFAYFG